MIRLFANAKYDFISYRAYAWFVTGAFVIPGFLLLLVRGIDYSIEFTGGAAIQIQTREAVGTGPIRAALEGGGVPGAEITTFGSPRDYLIRARLGADAGEGEIAAVDSAVRAALNTGIGTGTYTVQRTEAVGPKVGRELQTKAIIAVLFSFVTTLVYLAFRFEWRFGLAAVLATAHDIVATLAFIRYLNLEISLVVVAAVLTVVGYSLNDTIVIFDRVRENLRKFRRQDLFGILNLSVNETLPRTVLTGGTTLATALTLALLAGKVIQPFALVMAFGIIVGTFSSIYIASPLLLWIEQRWPGADARGVRALRQPGAEPAEPPRHVPEPGGRPRARV